MVRRVHHDTFVILSSSKDDVSITTMPNLYYQLRQDLNRSLFIPFTVIGDPDPDRSAKVIESLIEGGADALELGFPFSDPPADGPTIQAADVRALEAGVMVDDCFHVLKTVHEKHPSTPIGLLLYYNLVCQRGVDQFYQDCSNAGVTSVLIADLPLEHADEILPAAKQHGIQPIFLVSDLTTDERLAEIVKVAEGYLYVVSYTGITGKQNGINQEHLSALLERIRKQTDLPLCVGFGINTSTDVQAVSDAGADGIIVGSRIVKEIAAGGDVSALCRELKNPLFS